MGERDFSNAVEIGQWVYAEAVQLFTKLPDQLNLVMI